MKIDQFQPYLDESDFLALKESFDTKWITEGPKSKEFSEKLCNLIGAKHGVFASNGTIALYLGLRAVGVGRGDEVIVPNFTFIASANAVEMCGAKPVFVDINKDLQINVKDCNRVLNRKTKAIMPVHVFGMSANMGEVMKFANKNNLKVVEDAAQGIGITWNDKHVGSFGDVGCFSFFADKTITTGEGGFVVTNDDKIYENMLYLRNQGRLKRGSFVHPQIGYNFRLTDIQSSLGLNQLRKLKTIIKKKINILDHYKKRFSDLESVEIIESDVRSNHIPFRVVIKCKHNVEDLMKHLKESGVEIRNVFYPLHKQPCYKNNGKKWLFFNKNDDKFFKESINAYETCLCLPSFPDLKVKQINYVCKIIRNYYDTRPPHE